MPPGTADPIGALIETMVDPEVVDRHVPKSEGTSRDVDASAVLSKALGAPAAEPWRRRVVRALLYGRNADRNAKAQARGSGSPSWPSRASTR